MLSSVIAILLLWTCGLTALWVNIVCTILLSIRFVFWTIYWMSKVGEFISEGGDKQWTDNVSR